MVKAKKKSSRQLALRTFRRYYKGKPKRARRDRRRTAKILLSGRKGLKRYRKLGPNRADFRGVDNKGWKRRTKRRRR